MRYSPILAALILAPALAIAQTAADTQADPATKARPPHTSVPTSTGTEAAMMDFITFQPTPFESRLFQDPGKITQTTGEDIYLALCAGCHMPDAKGVVGAGEYPALAGNENLVVGDYPVMIIVDGLGGMPPFRQVLDDGQIVAVVEYLQATLTGTDVYPPTIEMVQQVRAVADPLPE